MINIKLICGTHDRDLIGAVTELRRRCWTLFYTNLEFLNDGHDSHAMHFIVLAERKVIAAARLCVHDHLQNTTEYHLYPMLDAFKFPGPYGCFTRLVVDAQFRGRGLAAILDQLRTDTAKRLGCSTILGSWNYHSGEKRRGALVKQGFINVSDGQPLPDGGFGMSFPYAKRMSVIPACASLLSAA